MSFWLCRLVYLILQLPSDFTVFPYGAVVCIWTGEGKDQLSVQYFVRDGSNLNLFDHLIPKALWKDSLFIVIYFHFSPQRVSI